jgi:serine/threonine protein kinase
MQFWQDLEGETLGGIYRLKKYVHGDESSALFTTEMTADNPDAYDVRVFRTESESEEGLLHRLENARQISHPNLVRMLKVDSAEVGAGRVVYAVAEHTEENLRDALRERALTEDETREVVRSLGSALRAIHGKQLVHGDVQPLNIFATAETIKLRGDCIVPAGTPAAGRELQDGHLPAEVSETGLTPASDIWSLGILICEAFNQQRPNLESPSLDSNEDLARVPEPFADIAKHCLAANPGERWKLEDITTALSAGAVSKPRQPAPTQLEIHTPEPESAPAPATAPVPASRETKPSEPAEFGSAYPRRRPLPPKHRSIPASLYAGGVVFALLLAGWLLLRPRAPKPAASSAPPVTTAEQHVANPEPATPAGVQAAPNRSEPSEDARGNELTGNRKESPMRRHDTTNSKERAKPGTVSGPAMNTSSVPPKTSGAKEERPVWRVIAYTYGKAEDAQRRVDQIKSKHPELGPEVFSAEPDHGPYLVVLGGQMDKNEATRLKRQAVSEGMPRDTYTQNYSR